MRPRYWRTSAVVMLLSISSTVYGRQLPDWTAKIRSDHPRLFFNADTWPAVRQRALGAERQWYSYIKGRVDRLKAESGSEVEPGELGPQAAWAAFVFRMTGDEQYLELAKKCLERSLFRTTLSGTGSPPIRSPWSSGMVTRRIRATDCRRASSIPTWLTYVICTATQPLKPPLWPGTSSKSCRAKLIPAVGSFTLFCYRRRIAHPNRSFRKTCPVHGTLTTWDRYSCDPAREKTIRTASSPVAAP